MFNAFFFLFSTASAITASFCQHKYLHLHEVIMVPLELLLQKSSVGQHRIHYSIKGGNECFQYEHTLITVLCLSWCLHGDSTTYNSLMQTIILYSWVQYTQTRVLSRTWGLSHVHKEKENSACLLHKYLHGTLQNETYLNNISWLITLIQAA